MSLLQLIKDALDSYDQRYKGFFGFGGLTQSSESAAAVLALRSLIHHAADDRKLLLELNHQLENRLKGKSTLRTTLESVRTVYAQELEQERQARAALKLAPKKPVVAPRPAVAAKQSAVQVAPGPLAVAPKPAPKPPSKASVAIGPNAVAPRPAPLVAPEPVAKAPDQSIPPTYKDIPFRLLRMGAQFTGEQYSKGWWFANFWEEVRVIDFGGLLAQAALEAERDELLGLAYSAVFQSNVTPTTAGTVDQFNRGTLKPKKHAFDDELFRSTLYTLFKYGYEEFGTKKLPFHRHKRVGGYLKDAATLFQKRIYQPPAAVVQAPGGQMQDLAALIGFRGEKRDARMVIQHGGATRKHLSMAAELHVDKPWHPFYGDVPSGMYYRRGAQDNDLITVHSIAALFDEATKFPLVSDQQLYRFEFPKDDAVRARAAAIKAGGAAVAKISIGGRDAWRVGTETNVHILTVAGPVGDTEQHQIDDKVGNPFRERAVADIALTQYLAAVRIQRVHYGPSWEDGHTVFVQDVHIIDAGRKAVVALALAGAAVAASSALMGRVSTAEALTQLRAYLANPVRHVNVRQRDKATAILEWDSA